MAVYALVGCVLIYDDQFFTHESGLQVALGTRHVGMASGESEMRPGVVIESGRHPALRVVAIGAVGLGILGDKLAVVNVIVASLTLLWCALESRFVSGGGFVAVAADHRSMRADKWEISFGMIEAVDVRPGLDVMASFATKGSPIGALACHAIVEFPFVRIFVTGGAIPIFEMVRNDFVAATRSAEFVAVRTGNGYMSTGKSEASVAMFGDSERGAMEILHGMAGFTAVVVGSGGKLIVVSVLVAIVAVFKFHFVHGIFSGGDVALCAVNGNVFALERIF